MLVTIRKTRQLGKLQFAHSLQLTEYRKSAVLSFGRHHATFSASNVDHQYNSLLYSILTPDLFSQALTSPGAIAMVEHQSLFAKRTVLFACAIEQAIADPAIEIVCQFAITQTFISLT